MGKNSIKHAFRKYHRLLAIIVCIPISVTVLTGIAVTLVEEWGLGAGIIPRSFLLDLHTGELFHLQAIYPLLNGLGLIGLLITGLSMSGLLSRKKAIKPTK